MSQQRVIRGTLRIDDDQILGCENCDTYIQDDDERLIDLVLRIPEEYFQNLRCEVKFPELNTDVPGAATKIEVPMELYRTVENPETNKVEIEAVPHKGWFKKLAATFGFGATNESQEK